MKVLVPAASEHGKAAGAAVAAQWQNVVLMASNAGFEDQGPGGHRNFPHPWPGQNPPPDGGGRVMITR